MKNKILLAVPQLSGGGAERVVSIWANELSKRNFQVSILVFARTSDEYYLAEDIKIFSIAGTSREYMSLSFFKRFIIMRDLLKKIRPGYVISFLPTMQVWLSFATIGLKIKRIETIRVNPWKIKFDNLLYFKLWRRCFKTCNTIILQSVSQMSFFNAKERKKCVIIPNPLSDVFIKNYKDTIPDSPREFIAVGRITPQKNYEMMIKTFSELCKTQSDLELKIFGTGDSNYVKEIEELILELHMQKNVFLMGRNKNIEEEYKKSDVFLMTSNYEGMPNSLIEAMASQLLCISTDCKTGPSDLLDNNENGYLVPVNDAQRLKEVVEDVLSMEAEKRNSIAKAARKKVMKFCSMESSMDILCSILC